MSVSRVCSKCSWRLYYVHVPVHLLLHGHLPEAGLRETSHVDMSHPSQVPRDILAVLLHALAMSRQPFWVLVSLYVELSNHSSYFDPEFSFTRFLHYRASCQPPKSIGISLRILPTTRTRDVWL